jgi:hypothetical protein
MNGEKTKRSPTETASFVATNCDPYLFADVSHCPGQSCDEVLNPSVFTLWRIKIKPVHDGLVIHNLASASARADFEAAWQVFLANRTEADFEAWRDQRDWTARKSTARPK